MVAAVVVSIVVHAVALSLNFKLPGGGRLKPQPQTLDVVLVNSKTKSAPEKPQVLAQANLDAGGNVEADRTPKTTMPVLREERDGNDLRQARRRVADLEAKSRQLMNRLHAQKAAVVTEPAKPEPAPVREPPQPSGIDLANTALALARMEAQVARQNEEYAKRPRRQFVGARASETRFALYVETWRQKVERVGNLNYPDAARGRIYGSLRLTVAIKSDGSVDSVQVDRPSGHDVLDRAAEKIVHLAGPFAAFPPDIRRDTDILVITRTWTFARGDRLYGE
ncbi:MAG: energy transducer TonB [Burkholderiales bacterium]|nr:energy transducer TonB [Burkholderiales bacterium]